MAKSDIYLPLNVKQLVDPVMQLPKKQRQQLMTLLLEKDITTPEQEKQQVRNRIKKYKARPDKLVPEAKALDKINADN